MQQAHCIPEQIEWISSVVDEFEKKMSMAYVEYREAAANSFCCDNILVAKMFFGITVTSAAVLAEILLRSPRKLFIFIIKKHIYTIKVSKN